MSVLLTSLLWTIFVLFFLALVLLALSLRLELSVRKAEHLQVAGVVRPLGRLGPGIPLKRSQSHKVGTEKPARKRRKRRRDMRGVAQALPRLLRDLLGLIRVEHLTLDAELGLDDPADTGQLYAALLPVGYAASGLPRVRVRFTPVFDRAALTGAADMALSVIPLMVLGAFLRFGIAVLRGAR